MGEKISLVQKAYASTVEKVMWHRRSVIIMDCLGLAECRGMDAASASLNIKLSIK